MSENRAEQSEQKTAESRNERLISSLSPLVEPLGYEIVALEIHTHRQKTLRLFIDRTEIEAEKGPIGVEDCARVSRALNEPLDTMSEVDGLFNGSTYELEVSSPGVDRPLRQERDFSRFAGKEARIHLFRPLTPEEIENAGYFEKNPRQKNFVGVLKGIRDGKVQLSLSPDSGDKSGKKGKAKKPARRTGKPAQAGADTNREEEVMIPLALISKANLEPRFELDGYQER